MVVATLSSSRLDSTCLLLLLWLSSLLLLPLALGEVVVTGCVEAFGGAF